MYRTFFDINGMTWNQQAKRTEESVELRRLIFDLYFPGSVCVSTSFDASKTNINKLARTLTFLRPISFATFNDVPWGLGSINVCVVLQIRDSHVSLQVQ